MPPPLSSSARNLIIIGSLAYLVMPALLPLISSAQVNPVDAEAQRQARNSSAFAIMLGEFRTSMSDLLFIKTERYLDRGVGYEPHVNTRAMASSEGAEDHKTGSGSASGHDEHDSHDHDHDHDHADEASAKTLIKSAGDDFRGFIGNLEREVKPWRKPGSPHDHAEGKAMSEVLPWYRLATLSNPHDVRNYYIGAWWLKTLRTQKQREEAVKFLNEGIEANPGAYELYLMKGFVLKDDGKMSAARDAFRRSAELGVKRRPAGGSASGKDPGWDVTNDEQLNSAIGMDVMLTRDLETTASAQQELRKYQQQMPDEPALGRMEHVLEEGN